MSSPAAPLILSSVARVTITSVTNNVRCENVFDYSTGVVGSVTAADLNAFRLAWQTAIQTQYRACLSPVTALESIAVSEIHYGYTPTQVFLHVPGVVGTAGASCLPLEMAATLSRVSALKGKHGRGRVSMPAIPDTFTTPATDPNVLNLAGAAAYNLLSNLLKAPIVSGVYTWTPVISTRPVPPKTLVDFAASITDYLTRTVLGTVRRRKPGRGI